MSCLRTLTSLSRAAPRRLHLQQQQPLANGGMRAFSNTPWRLAEPADASAQSGGARSKEAEETGSSPTAGQVGNDSVDSVKPSTKIQDSPSADKNSKEYQKEVDEHNKEFEEGHDRANAAGEDKVDKKFWEGQKSGEKTEGT